MIVHQQDAQARRVAARFPWLRDGLRSGTWDPAGARGSQRAAMAPLPSSLSIRKAPPDCLANP